MSNYCPNCGNKIDDGELFCPECGSKIVEKNNASKKAIIDEDDKISKKIKERSEKFNSKNNNSNTLFDKINLKLVIIIIFLAIIGFVAISSISHNDMVEVQDATIDYSYAGTSRTAPSINGEKSSMSNGQKATFSINVVPKQNILYINGVRLENVIITLENGTKLNIDSADTNVYMSDVKMPSSNLILSKDMSYILKFSTKLPFQTELRSPVTHITGDLVIDTTSNKNMICGHVDSDIVSEK